MAIGQQNCGAVLAHHSAGRTGRVVGNIIFFQILIINSKRSACQKRKIPAGSRNIQDLLAGWERAQYRPVVPDSQDGIAVSGLIEIHDKRNKSRAVQCVVLEIGILKGIASEALTIQIVKIQRVLSQDSERISGQEVQIVDQGIPDGDGAENFLGICPEENDRGLEHAVLLP